MYGGEERKSVLIVMYVCVLDSGTIKGGDRSAVFRASRPKKSASGREASKVTAARSKALPEVGLGDLVVVVVVVVGFIGWTAA
jgi:hypothetical protein